MEAGDAVSQGEALIRLDSPEHEVGLRQAEAGVLSAQSNLEAVQAGVALS